MIGKVLPYTRLGKNIRLHPRRVYPSGTCIRIGAIIECVIVPLIGTFPTRSQVIKKQKHNKRWIAVRDIHLARSLYVRLLPLLHVPASSPQAYIVYVYVALSYIYPGRRSTYTRYTFFCFRLCGVITGLHVAYTETWEYLSWGDSHRLIISP